MEEVFPEKIPKQVYPRSESCRRLHRITDGSLFPAGKAVVRLLGIDIQRLLPDRSSEDADYRESW